MLRDVHERFGRSNWQNAQVTCRDSMLAMVGIMGALLAPVTTLAAEPQELSDGIAQLLLCGRHPDPTALLTLLERTGRISVGEAIGADSINCWDVHPPIELDGVSFGGVCASNPEPLSIAAFPQFYWRGPGTSPGASVSLVTTSATTEDLAAWSASFLGEHHHATVDAAYVLDGNEVSCSEYNLAPPEAAK